MNGPVFPPAENDGHGGCLPFVNIAEFMKCDKQQVLSAFSGVDVPEWSTPRHLDTVKTTTHKLNKAARHASKLADALFDLHESERDDLITTGTVTYWQVQHLADVLNGNAKGLDDWLKSQSRQGGRNPAAHAIGEGMRRLFRRLRKSLRMGVNEAGLPSTEFGRAVEFALGEFGIIADWRRPTEAARDKQLRIENRKLRCAMNKFQSNPSNANSK